jgi:hypothetical protein
MTIRECLLKLIDDGVTEREDLIKQTCKMLRVKRNNVLRMLNKLKVTEVQQKAPKANLKTLKIKEVIEREKLDHLKIVKDALENFTKDECIYDEDLRANLGISKERWKLVRNDDQLLQFQVQLPNKKRVWAKNTESLLKIDGVTEVLYV